MEIKMQNDIQLIKLISLEVTTDGIKYERHREINGEELGSTFAFLPSTLDLFIGLLESGRSLCDEGSYTSFRLKVFLEDETFFLYDAPSEKIEQKSRKEADVPAEEYQRYESLTKREKQILCFLYRGYEQDAIAYVFGLTVHSIKKHRHNIYKKARFRNRTELAVWCEKYLHSVFKLSA